MSVCYVEVSEVGGVVVHEVCMCGCVLVYVVCVWYKCVCVVGGVCMNRL